jgi:hypothetical protein
VSPAVAPSEGAAHDLVDEALPEQFDWERLVRAYPIPALLLAAVGGFVLGRSRGSAVLGALGAFAASQVADEVHRVLGEDVLAPE